MASLFDQFLQHPDIEEHPKGGGEAKAWCPWHPDKEGGNPSLGINVRKQIVKCFVCGNGGAKALALAWGISDEAKSDPPWKRDIHKVFDYHKADSSLVFQVVRLVVPPGAPKEIIQRRPDPDSPSQWVWNLKGITPVLYRLPGLRAAPKEQIVFIVEGEPDADRLTDRGLVATTNPMGAGKWRAHYTREFKERYVAIIPDNDDPGREHAATVARAVSEVAAEVKILELPDLPEKGDVSDWLDAGHDISELDELLSQIPPYEPPRDPQQDLNGSAPDPEWKVSSHRPHAIRITGLLNNHGYFVNGGVNAFFFDSDTKRLTTLDRDDQYLRILLSDRYHLNRQDTLYNYLLEHMLVEAHTRGRHTQVRQFSHYNRETNTVLLDMGEGRVLKITGAGIEIRDNGDDGVLFEPLPDHDPWDYKTNSPEGLVYQQMVQSINFSEDHEIFNVEEQQALLLVWLLSFAFESRMPARPLVMAIGQSGSGKSTLFRSVGRMLIGQEFDVFVVGHDMKVEDDFWSTVTNSFFCAFDNVDQPIKWLPDALATVATGATRSRRQLHTTNQMVRYKVSSMVGVTARTPTHSLRREDVAARTIVLTLAALPEKGEESVIYDAIIDNRDALMSDYARMIQKALRIAPNEVHVADKGMRMADFARVAGRLSLGLGDRFHETTMSAMSKMQTVQQGFATEEDVIAELLSIWITRHKPMQADQPSMEVIKNNGRRLGPTTLYKELQGIAKEYDIKTYLQGPNSLGAWLRNMKTALSNKYLIETGQGKIDGRKTRWWSFTELEHPSEPSE